jgi:Cytochrome c554 and c-prime
MNSTKVLLASQASVLILAMAGFFVTGVSAAAQDVQHLIITQPGGMPGKPVMTGISRGTNGVTVTWDGPSGYYQLLQKQDLKSQSWQSAGGPNLTRKATITTLTSNAFFRVSGPAPRYAGSQVCLECHEEIHNVEVNTRHSAAFTNTLFRSQGGQTNSACLPCHTVGYGLPTGFDGKANKLNLTGVQCESCHGPAGNHAANEGDLTVRPRVELAAQVCGGCHTGSRHPTFDEWKTSGHFAVVEDMSPTDRVNSCGRCHSGSSRLALIKGENPSVTVTNDANVGITCVVCHDPHANHVWTNVMTGIIYTNQLRQALSSTNDFFLSTSDTFTNKYNPNINICAQCHNHRGASWTSSSRPPHHSPQYNMLLGTVGVLAEGVSGGPAAHAGTEFVSDDAGRLFLVTNQCVTCHMQTGEYQHGPPEVAAVTGHKFEVASYGACADCHGSGANAQGLVVLVSGFVSNQIQQVKALLDTWAATKAPGSLYATYGTRAWEYTTPGDLSPGGSGPSTSEQALIPDNIKKARFDLYLVLYDGSYGVHNGPYASTLLESARNWVQQELNN